MTKFGTIRYCPDCGAKLKDPQETDCGCFRCYNHGYVFIEFSIDADDVVVKQE